MPEDGKVDPLVASALRQAAGTIPVTTGERLRFEFVVDMKGEIKCSFPPPQNEAEFWKMMAYLPDFAKAHYAQKRSPLAI
jgi:hypothetical protein